MVDFIGWAVCKWNYNTLKGIHHWISEGQKADQPWRIINNQKYFKFYSISFSSCLSLVPLFIVGNPCLIKRTLMSLIISWPSVNHQYRMQRWKISFPSLSRSEIISFLQLSYLLKEERHNLIRFARSLNLVFVCNMVTKSSKSRLSSCNCL